MRQYSLYAADCVLARPLAEPLSLGFDAGISPGHRQTPMHFAASQLRGGLVPTPTGLSPASQVQLRWTHNPIIRQIRKIRVQTISSAFRRAFTARLAQCSLPSGRPPRIRLRSPVSSSRACSAVRPTAQRVTQLPHATA